jgi:hypothetical protein
MSEKDLKALHNWIASNKRKICNYSNALTYPSLGILSLAIEKLVLLLRQIRNTAR